MSRPSAAAASSAARQSAAHSASGVVRVASAWTAGVRSIDLPRIRLHDLRYTHATILLQQGINPKVVSERLGHASVSFTMDVYQHVLPGMQAQAAATFGSAFNTATGASIAQLPEPRPKGVTHLPEPTRQACTGTAQTVR